MKGTWQTTDSGGGGIGAAVLVVLAAVVAAAIARPVIAALGELLRLALVAAVVLAGLGLAGGAALVTLRLRQRHANRTTRVPTSRPLPSRPSQALSAPRRSAAALPARPEVHLHFHGVTAEDIAAALRQLP